MGGNGLGYPIQKTTNIGLNLNFNFWMKKFIVYGFYYLFLVRTVDIVPDNLATIDLAFNTRSTAENYL